MCVCLYEDIYGEPESASSDREDNSEPDSARAAVSEPESASRAAVSPRGQQSHTVRAGQH
jgi:hypothetical protein